MVDRHRWGTGKPGNPDTDVPAAVATTKPACGLPAKLVLPVVLLLAGVIVAGCSPGSPDAGVTVEAGSSKPPAKPILPENEVPTPRPLAKRPSPHPTVLFHAQPKPLPAGAITSDWPTFLGPTRNGVSVETKLLKRWPKEGPTLLWEMETGSGFASPSVAGERLIFFHRIGDQETVECLHAESGERYWEFHYPTTYEDYQDYNDGPKSTPVIDDGRVYTIGAEGKLHCLDLQTGKLIWKRDMLSEFKVPKKIFGVCSTPLVEGEVVIVNVGAARGPCVAAIDKRTGKTVWEAGSLWSAGYGSPVPAVVHGQRRVFVFSGMGTNPTTGGLYAIDPLTGAIDVRFPFHSRSTTVSVNASTPVVVGSQVFISTAYRTGGVLINIKPGGGYEVAWKTDALRAHFATPIHRDGYLYGFDGYAGSGALVCVDLKTGEGVWRKQPIWEEEIEGNEKKKSLNIALGPGALLFADGNFLCLSDMGHLLWLDLTPVGYKELIRARLFLAKDSWTTPALSRGLLYVRQNTPDRFHNTKPRLLCYDLRAK